MKKLIRFILKIPGTFVMAPFFIMMIVASYVDSFFGWLYDKSEFDRRITQETRYDFMRDLKKWFTTI